MIVAMRVAVAVAAMLVRARVPVFVGVIAIVPAIASGESDRRDYDQNGGCSMKYFHRYSLLT
jgi:hypothetical protein